MFLSFLKNLFPFYALLTFFLPIKTVTAEMAPYTCEDLVARQDPRPRFYFSSSKGTNSGTGTEGNPYNNFYIIQQLDYSKGAILCLKANDQFSQSLTLKNLGQRQEFQTIDITLYGGSGATSNDRALFTPPTSTVAPQSKNNASYGYTVGLEITNTGNVKVQGIRVDGQGKAGLGILLQASDSSLNLPEDRKPITLDGGSTYFYSNFYFSHVEAKNFRLASVLENPGTDENKYQWDMIYPFGHGMMIRGAQGIAGIGITNATVEDSEFHHNEVTGILSFAAYSNYDGLRNGGIRYPHKSLFFRRIQTHDNSGVSRDTMMRLTQALPYPRSQNTKGNIGIVLERGICAGSGILMANVDGGFIEDSKSYENGRENYSGYGPVGIWAFASNNVTIQRNESFRNRTQRADGGGFDLDIAVSNSKMQYNYSHENDGAGYLMTSVPEQSPNQGNIIRFNLSVNDAQERYYPYRTPYEQQNTVWPGGIHIHNYVTDAYVYNNTIINDHRYPNDWNPMIGSGIRISQNTSRRILISNNIFQIRSSAVPHLVFENDTANASILFLANGYSTDGRILLIHSLGQIYTSLTQFRNSGQETLSGYAFGYAGGIGLQVPSMLDGTQNLNGLRLSAANPLLYTGWWINFGIFSSSLPPDMGGRDFAGAEVTSGNYSTGAFMAPRAGFYRTSTAGYYMNNQAHYCRISSWQQWLNAGGPADLSTVSYFNPQMNQFQSDGICQ